MKCTTIWNRCVFILAISLSSVGFYSTCVLYIENTELRNVDLSRKWTHKTESRQEYCHTKKS